MKKPRVIFMACMMLISLLGVGYGAANMGAMASESEGTADLVLRNGAIYMVDEAKTWAEAVAVQDERIVFVGSNEGVSAYIGDQTTIIDLEGKMVLPGFHDSHMHPLESGSSVATTCQLTADTPPEQYINQLRECAPNQVGTNWVLGGGHSIHTLLESERLPIDILDEAIPDRPAVMLEQTSHSVWVNSQALQAAGIDANTPDPAGGIIDHDPDTGELTGILFENAGNMTLDLAFARNAELDELAYQGLLFGLEQIALNGITSVVDARLYWQRGHLEVWQRAVNQDTLTARAVLGLWAYPHLDDTEQIQSLISMYSNDPNSLLRVSQVKMYSDGLIENGTAALLAPYNESLGVTSDTGMTYFDQTRLTRYVTELERAGFDLHIHTIGDRAVREGLNAIESAQNTNGNTINRRHRLTHVELIDAADRPRFAQLGVIADFQMGELADPNHATHLEPLIGDRASEVLPIRALHDAGVTVTMSSDWDVNPISPFQGIEPALMRGDKSLPDLDAAIRAYTINAAYLMRQENRTGSIEVGKFADLIVLSQNIFDIPVEEISQTTVLRTILGGETVYPLTLTPTVPPTATITPTITSSKSQFQLYLPLIVRD
ncbi:MAG: amidohydrolase [Ardenticatenaceae bacterium]